MADSRFLASRPRRILEWEEDGQGRVIVFRPRFGSGAWGRRFSSWLGVGPYRIRLDEVGSLVWKHCDGDTDASEIAVRLRGAFGERVEPAEDLLERFLSQMHRARMIAF